MGGSRPVAAVVGLAALGLAGCGSGGVATKAKATANQCSPGKGLTQTATTPRYAMVLDVAAREAMYTPAQVAAQHVTTGEVMLRGQMTAMSGTGDAGSSTSTMPATPGTAQDSQGASMPSTTMPMSQTTDTAMGGTNGPSADRHLEVHICSRSAGQVIQDAQPTITIVDRSSGAMIQQVPVAVMEGVGAGAKDLHYGNNITMPAGHLYAVTVTLGSETATFNFTGPS